MVLLTTTCTVSSVDVKVSGSEKCGEIPTWWIKLFFTFFYRLDIIRCYVRRYKHSWNWLVSEVSDATESRNYEWIIWLLVSRYLIPTTVSLSPFVKRCKVMHIQLAGHSCAVRYPTSNIQHITSKIPCCFHRHSADQWSASYLRNFTHFLNQNTPYCRRTFGAHW